MSPHGEFVWVDLSTFDLGKAQSFYSGLLGWNYSNQGDGYLIGAAAGQSCAGLYTMPEFFQKINMPSFWMTYIAVDSIDEVVAKAKEHGAKVELEETNALGKIALIRDPLGAGFTCYEGELPSALETGDAAGRWSRSELIISDFSRIQKFYTELFNWNLQPDETADRYQIQTQSGKSIGFIQQAEESERGEKEYWMLRFQVADLSKALTQVQASGGEVVQHAKDEATCYDNQGAYFGLQESPTGSSQPVSKTAPFKWRTILGLALLYPAILLEWNFLWGLLFLIWVIPDLKSGTTHFIEPLHRKENPALYWLVVTTWLSLSVYMLLMP